MKDQNAMNKEQEDLNTQKIEFLDIYNPIILKPCGFRKISHLNECSREMNIFKEIFSKHGKKTKNRMKTLKINQRKVSESPNKID